MLQSRRRLDESGQEPWREVSNRVFVDTLWIDREQEAGRCTTEDPLFGTRNFDFGVARTGLLSESRSNQSQCNIAISTSSVANYLEGQMFTAKRVHWQSVTINSEQNKELRKIYVTSLNNYVQGGNRIMWIDETNFNLFCRRTCGRSRQGNRATASRPASRGKFYSSRLNPIFTYSVTM